MHNTKILVMHGIKNFIPVETAAERRQMPTKVIFLCQKELKEEKKTSTKKKKKLFLNSTLLVGFSLMVLELQLIWLDGYSYVTSSLSNIDEERWECIFINMINYRPVR